MNKSASGWSLFLVIFAVHSLAMAQSTSTSSGALVEPPKTAAEKKKEEQTTGKPPPKVAKKIVITGSYIRRAADEGAPSPVSTIDNTKAQEAGTYSAAGMLGDNAVVSSGTSNNISFHGQSSANNLVLLNGLRLPKSGGNDTASVDFIPASAIERMEILKDGASALYGSEALAGVVNIITKKEFDGANIFVRHSRPEAAGLGKNFGTENNITATYGKTLKNGNILGVLQYRGNQATMFTDTEYGIQNVLLRGSEVSNPGNLIKTNNPKANYHAADCPSGLVDAQNLCRYDYTDFSQFSPETNQYNALLTSGFDLGNALRLEAAIVYSRAQTNSSSSPIFYKFSDQTGNGGSDYSIPGTVAGAWAPNLIQPGGGSPAIAPGDKFTLSYSPDQELGNKINEFIQDAGAAQFSVGKETDDLDWNLSVGYSASYSVDTMVSGNARRDVAYDKLLTGAWNPFLPTASKDPNVLADARIRTWNKNFADVINTRFILSGKEVDLGPRSIYAAVGVEHQYQGYRFRVDDFSLTDNNLTGSGSNQTGTRNVASTFLELTQNPIPALQVQLAGRFDAYSDFGTTINPKIAAAYKFNDVATMRGSYGTGFKAPDLRAIYQGRLARQQRIRDEVSCVANGANHPSCNTVVSTTNAGNPDLDPELGKHINLGLQLRPRKNWQINIDHWRAQGEEAITEISSGLLTRLTQVEQSLGPSAAAAALSQLGVEINRNPDGSINFIDYPYKTNSGRYKVNGIDFEVKYKNQINPFNLGTMNFGFRFDHSHTLRKESQAFFFLPLQQAYDINWKNVSSVSLSKGNHLGSWRVRTYSSGDKDPSQTPSSIGIGSIPTIAEHDIHYEYYGAWDGVISAGVRNVFDKLYYNEFSRGQNGFLYAASPTGLGRTFYMSYSQDF